MDVPDSTLTISKREGAARQVEEAIKAIQRGDFDIAITLAGAAEGMLERRGLHLWGYSLERATARGFKKNEFVSVSNAQRDWLKHSTKNELDTLTITRRHALGMIMRAMSKLEPRSWSPLMNEYKAWLERNVDAL